MKTRKERIKTITIIFLAVLLVLTLFSNTIMNYSLVEVSTEMVTGDKITTKVRGSGSVTASEPYTLNLKETRKIAKVNVKTGAEVNEGDLLLTLEDMESEELQTARDSLLAAEKDYETAVISSGITAAERSQIEAGAGSKLDEKLNALEKAQAEIDKAQAKVDKLNAKKMKNDSTSVDTTKETKNYANAKKKLANAEADKTDKELAQQVAQTKYTELLDSFNATYGNLDSISTEDMTDIQKQEYDQKKAAKVAAEAQLQAAKLELNNAYDAVVTATKNVNTLSKEATEASEALEAAKDTTAKESAGTKIAAQLEEANRELETVTNEYTALTTKYSAQVALSTQYEALAQMRAKVEKLSDESLANEVTSPIAGTITEIAYTAGQTVNAQETILSIQPQNKAFTLQFSVTANQAKRIKVGDNAEIMYNWGGSDVSAKVSSIRKDPQNRESSIVICDVSGDVNVGDNYTVSIGEQSAYYDFIVPTSCIKEDNNGHFILTIESKSTPLGNRYYARRVDVEVVTADDTRTAITGPLEGGEYVITTTTKPIEANQQVRLAD